MKHRRSFSRGPNAYRRGNARVPSSGKAFLIVTEGQKTEPNYLKALRDRLQLAVADVDIDHPEGTDPVTLTKRAIELRNRRRREAKNGFKIPYDEVWVVFDLEQAYDERRRLADQAKSLKEAKDIHFASSDPCFEYWLLLHEKYTTAPLVDCAAVIELLKTHLPGYAKGFLPSSEFLEKIPQAVNHAERCRKHHKDTNSDGNPSTNMDMLVRCLNEATRKHLQFRLPS